MEAYNTWLIIAEKYMISKFTVFCSERPTFKETTKKNRRDNPPYLCRPDFHGMNYSSYWIFYGNSSIFYIIAVKNIFIYAIIIMNVVVKWYFVILEIGIPHLNFLGAECEMWFGTAKTENSPRLSPRHLTRCWSNNGFFCLPPLIDSSLSSFNASQTIKTNILENKYWLAYGKKWPLRSLIYWVLNMRSSMHDGCLAYPAYARWLCTRPQDAIHTWMEGAV